MLPEKNNLLHTQQALVVGASSGIAQSLITELSRDPTIRITGVSRSPAPQENLVTHFPWHITDYSPQHIQQICQGLKTPSLPVTRVFICNGILHDGEIMPERKLESFDYDVFSQMMAVNTGIAAHFLQGLINILKHQRPCIFTCFSARIGSISDNRNGGWYSYRMSKAALNMLIKTAAIEYARRAKNVKLLAFHPGTTDTRLSQPFQANVNRDKLFTTDFVAEQLMGILDQLEFNNQPDFLDWQGKNIEW